MKNENATWRSLCFCQKSKDLKLETYLTPYIYSSPMEKTISKGILIIINESL